MEAKEELYKQRGPDRTGNQQQLRRQQVLLLRGSGFPGVELLVGWQVSACAKKLGVRPGNLISVCKVAIPLLDASVSCMLLIPLERGLQHTAASLPLALHCLKTLDLSWCEMAGCSAHEAEEIKTGSGLGLVLSIGVILTLVPSPYSPFCLQPLHGRLWTP